jgi:hypothetical protein
VILVERRRLEIRTMKKILAAVLLLQLSVLSTAQSVPKRMIDRCAQDGLYFYAQSDDPKIPIQLERDGVTVRIDHPDPKGVNAVIAFSREGHTLIQKPKDFEAAFGWVTVSENGAFAATWNYNASASDAQLFLITSIGEIVEDTQLIASAGRQFMSDARRHCRNPGLNTQAIKWIDKDHLLISMNAWSSGLCYSNFTEGFVLDVPAQKIQRMLTDEQLINLPAVCTWNIVPSGKH